MNSKIVERADGLMTIDHPLRIGPLPLGTRSTLVRLASGGLLVHSPGPLDGDLRDQIESCGAVEVLVAPNCMHHLFLADNALAWPAAAVFLAPGLREKRADLQGGEVLGEAPPEAWRGVLEQIVTAGAPRLGEVAFLHTASRTLILCDLAFNIRSIDSVLARGFMRLNGMFGHFGPSRIARLLFFQDRAALRTSVERILAWDFDRVIVGHGEIVESGGRGLVEEAFAFLGD